MPSRADIEAGTKRKHHRRLPWVVAAAFLILGGAFGWTIATYPATAAIVCPSCYGLEREKESVYVERGVSTAQRDRVVDAIRQAERRLRSAYRERQSSPRILACLTDDCYTRIGGGQERGVAVLDRAVMLSPRGLDPVIAAHEQAHVELHRRLDGSTEVPQWFDEGLAVLVADDLRYLRPSSAQDRCRAEPSKPLPTSLHAWLQAASADSMLYAKAACQVSRSLDEHDSRSAIPHLIRKLNNGESFDAVVD